MTLAILDLKIARAGWKLVACRGTTAVLVSTTLLLGMNRLDGHGKVETIDKAQVIIIIATMTLKSKPIIIIIIMLMIIVVHVELRRMHIHTQLMKQGQQHQQWHCTLYHGTGHGPRNDLASC